ncbi:MAG TPA: hypothetical protein VER96_38875 [Polyangiaceae bacterium]|nr:hypothetical protein [Polyangiaceae bacterium]
MISIDARMREAALVPSAALALREVTQSLVARLLELDEQRLSRLRAVRGADFLLLQGSSSDLPWCDGLIYLGKDEAAPQLLLPTTVTPNVPTALFERALVRHCQSIPAPLLGPWAVSFEPPLLISLAESRPLSPERVRRWFDVSQAKELP